MIMQIKYHLKLLQHNEEPNVALILKYILNEIHITFF